ncbi:related to histone acetyltransferase (MysT1) [Ramularia collo-cygni]|uniref:histone acetyltransferase n=1 Tax=Ramularia collo-cygni TaxID=112498 RepID=A0A2D3V1W8_9PEZI|nr:related to histone acetyltransferase (MysT1) [Ramularia collo-cygni]CZT14223.1 related to histone acetyltransferase (MysT1) [Ramularia collo-cygni]
MAAPNVTNVVLGNLHIKPWYPSFYPEDLIGGRKADWLYVCQWCFKYTPEIMKYCAHGKVCPMKTEAPPGEVIYEQDDYFIHKIDGEEFKLYAQNLSLFAKLFLETKSVFFDASTFLYYTLVLKTKDHPYGQVAGFFSKEKMSWDNNNLACILVFPPWQRRGLGQVLIGASYVLGKREGRFGGPERPLSNLGSKGYVAYWCGEIARFVLQQSKQKTLAIKEISDKTWIMPDDVVTALREMDVLEKRKTASGSIVINKGRIRQWMEQNRASLHPVVDVDAFVEENIIDSELSEMSE